MRTLKFRQPIINRDKSFKEWFYWGFVDGSFIEPAIQSCGMVAMTANGLCVVAVAI